MAVDVCCEIASLVTSPRISFSHDDGIPIECHSHFNRSDAFLLESSSSTIDFDFCVTDHKQLISSADELFSNGKILPFEIKKPTTSFDQSFQKQPEISLLENSMDNTNKKKSLKEFLSTDLDDDGDEELQQQETEKLPQAKPFWQFRRSSSLNYQNSQNNGLLHFLARSYSTGSAPTQKHPKIYQKQSSQREQREKIKVLRKSSSLSSSSSSSSSSSFSHPLHSLSSSSSSSSKKSQSHPLKKSYSRSYGNGIHVSPVLNIPHGYISKGTICLFGLGSFFCNGKSKKKK